MRKPFVVALAAALSVAGLTAVPTGADHEIVVQPGDSMQSISVRFYGDASHVREIASYNHLASPDLIFVGLRLMLPDLPAGGSDAARSGAPRAAEAAGARPPGNALAGTSDQQPPLPPGAPSAVPSTMVLPILPGPGSPDAPPGPAAPLAAPVIVPVIPGQPIQTGLATWYGPGFVGNLTYCGDVYDQFGFTAASNTLPCGTIVIVTNQATGASVRVRVNDRGAFGFPVILDLSRGAFNAIAPEAQGVVQITVSLPP
jgi:rare lipoprotein A